jgi:hypothetical protein
MILVIFKRRKTYFLVLVSIWTAYSFALKNLLACFILSCD